jgi:hypothetical protein
MVDPPRGCCREVRQQPLPKLETSMVAPLGGDVGRFGSDHHRNWRVDGGPLGVLSGFLTAATTEVGDIDGAPLGVLSGFPTSATPDAEDVNDGLPGGAVRISGSGHHQSWRRQWRGPWGCCRDFRQRPPRMLKTSMARPPEATSEVRERPPGVL